MPNREKIKTAYEIAKKYYDVGSEDDFASYMDDEDNRKALFEDMTNNLGLKFVSKTADEFSDSLGYGRAKPLAENNLAEPGKMNAVYQPQVQNYQPQGNISYNAPQQVQPYQPSRGIAGNIPTEQMPANYGSDYGTNDLMSSLKQMQQQTPAPAPQVDWNAHAVNRYTPQQKQQTQMQNLYNDNREQVNFNNLYESAVKPAIDTAEADVRNQYEQSVRNQDIYSAAHPQMPNGVMFPDGSTRLMHPKDAVDKAVAALTPEVLNNYVMKQYGVDINSLSDEDKRQISSEVAQQIQSRILDEYSKANAPKNWLEYAVSSGLTSNLTANSLKGLANISTLASDKITSSVTGSDPDTHGRLTMGLQAHDMADTNYINSVDGAERFGARLASGMVQYGSDMPWFSVFSIPASKVGDKLFYGAKRFISSAGTETISGKLATKALSGIGSSSVGKFMGKAGNNLTKYVAAGSKIPANVAQISSSMANFAIYDTANEAASDAAATYVNNDGILVRDEIYYEDGVQKTRQVPMTLGNIVGDLLGAAGSGAAKGLTFGLASKIFKPLESISNPLLKVGAYAGAMGAETAAFTGTGIAEELLSGKRFKDLDIANMLGQNVTTVLGMRLMPNAIMEAAYRFRMKPGDDMTAYERATRINAIDKEVMARNGYDFDSLFDRFARVDIDKIGAADMDEFTAEYNKFITDNNVPMNLREKMRSIVEGRKPQEHMASGARSAQLEDGRWGVETIDTAGQVIDMTIVDSEEEAKAIIESDILQDEFERSKITSYEAALGDTQSVANSLAAAQAAREQVLLAQGKIAKAHTSQEILDAYKRVREGNATDEDNAIVDQFTKDLGNATVLMHDYNVLKASQKAAEKAFGDKNQYAKVQLAAKKHRYQRTPEEQKAVDIYTSELAKTIDEIGSKSRQKKQRYQMAVAEATRPVDEVTNTATGEVITATTWDGKEVNVTGGRLVTNPDGTLDLKNSSRTIIVRDQNGKKSMISPDDLLSVDSRMSAEEYKKGIADQIRTETEQQDAMDQQQTLDIAKGEVEKAEKDTQKKVEEEVQKAGAAQEKKVPETTGQEPVKTETPKAEGAEAGRKVRYIDDDDQERTGELVTELPNFMVVIHDPERGNVTVSERFVTYEDEAPVEKTPVAAETPKTEAPKVETPKAETPAPKVEVQPEKPAEKPEVKTTKNGILLDKDGKPVFTAADPQQGLDYLSDELGMSENKQAEFLKGEMDRIDKETSEVYAQMPKMGNDKEAFQREMAEWEKAVNRKTAEYEHYQKMYDALRGKRYFPFERNGRPTKVTTNEPKPNKLARLVVGSHGNEVSQEDQALLDQIGRQWNMPIILTNEKENPNVAGMRGRYINGKIFINLSNKSGRASTWIIGHEITHRIKVNAPESFKNLIESMRRYYGDSYQSKFDHMMDLYKGKMDEDGIKEEDRKAYIEEEMASDMAGNLINADTDFAKHVMKEAQIDSDYAVHHLGTVRNVINVIRESIRRFGRYFSPQELDYLYDARDAWEKCYRQAVAVNGAKGGDRASIDYDPKSSIGGEEDTKQARLEDTINPDEVEKSNHDSEIFGGIIHDKEGQGIGIVDKFGTLIPKYSLDDATEYQDNLGNWHKGTIQSVLDYMKEKKYSSRQIKQMKDKMDWWYGYMKNLTTFTNPDGSLRFPEFIEWNKRTPEYKSVGQDMEKALSSLVNNGEYPINVELTTDCIKREAFTQLLNEMVRIDDGSAIRNMNPAEITAIQDMMKTYGIQTACPLCFVEGKRLGIRNWAERIVHDWNCELNDALDLGVEKVKVPLGNGEFYYAIDANAVAEAIEKKYGTNDSRFNFGQGDYVSEKSLDAMADMSERQRQAKLINETFDLLAGRKGGILPEDFKVIQKNAKAVEAKILELENAWYQKNPDKPYEMSKEDADIIAKMQNANMKQVARKMARAMAQYPELRKVLTLNDLIGSTGLDAIRTRNGEAYKQLFSCIVSRFGAGTPKVVQRAEPYDGEILALDDRKIESANNIGGSRMFSFSDFDITKVFDIMQIFFDAEARGLKLQSYSKEVPYILMFGRNTNAKINMSTLVEVKPKEEDIEAYRKASQKEKDEIKHRIAEYAGLELDKDGNIIGFQWSNSHSVSPAFAERIFRDPDYNANCGATTVGVSVNHTIYSCLTPWIRQVIPFHLSGMPIAARERTDVGWYRDSTKEQNTRVPNGKGEYVGVNSKWAGDNKNSLGEKHTDFMFYDGEDKPGWDMRDRCRQYIAWCNNRGYLPRFEWAINSDNYAKWCKDNGYEPNKQILDAMKAHESEVTIKDEYGKKQKIKMFDGYYKVITDFNCYKPEFDAEGNMIGEKNAPHTNIKADFVKDKSMLDMIFEDEDSMLQNRENNIRNADENISQLAYKATQFLKGKMTLEEAKNPDAKVFKNAEDSQKYLDSLKPESGNNRSAAIESNNDRYSIDEPEDLGENVDGKEAIKKAGIEEGKEFDSYDAKKLFKEFNSNENSSELFDRICNRAFFLGVRYKVLSDNNGMKGLYGLTSGGKISINKDYLENPNIPAQRKAQTILHETLHGVSQYIFDAIDSNSKNLDIAYSKEQIKELKSAVQDIKDVYKALSDDPEFKGTYGSTAYYEAFAEMANASFRDKLKSMNLWEKFVDGIRRFVRAVAGTPGTSTTAYEKMDHALDTILRNPSYSYMRALNEKVSKFADEVKDAAGSARKTREASRNQMGVSGDSKYSLDDDFIGEPGSRNDLKKNVSDEEWKRNMSNIFTTLPQGMRDTIVDEMRGNDSYDITDATLKHLAGMVENRDDSSIWKGITDAVNKAYGTTFNEGQAKYMIWRTARNMDEKTYGSTGDLAEDYAMRLHNGMLNNDGTTTPPTGGDDNHVYSRFSLEPTKDEEEFRSVWESAKDNIGIVRPNLKDQLFEVVPLEKHPFKGTGLQAIEQAREWALNHLAGITTVNEGKENEYKYYIDPDVIGKYLSGSSTRHSENLGLHLATLMKLKDVIEKSLDTEIHPDYKKIGKVRSPENGIDDEDLLIHRLYGAASLDDIIYKVKTTFKEKLNSKDFPYNYEITKVESPISGSTVSNALGESTFVTGANLLNNVEKSYEKGKNLLDASEKATKDNFYLSKSSLDDDQIDSDNFKRWFGNWYDDPDKSSKVVDDLGRPLIVYHGSDSKDFNIFDTGEFKGQVGAWFTDREDIAKTYQEAGTADTGNEGFVKGVYLNMRKPFVIDADGKGFNEIPSGYEVFDNENDKSYHFKTKDEAYGFAKEKGISEENVYVDGIWDSRDLSKYAKDNGYDGLIIKNVHDSAKADTEGLQTDYVVFDPKQIKSATDNNGNFDGSNPDIRYSLDEAPETDTYDRDQQVIEGLKKDLKQYQDELNGILAASGTIGIRENGETRYTQIRADEIANRLRDFVRNRLNPTVGQRIGSYEINSLIRDIEVARNSRKLMPIVRKIQQTISNVEIKAEYEQMLKILKTKTQSLTPRKLVKGILVDMDTHQILENIRGSFTDMMITTKDIEIKEINHQINLLKQKYKVTSQYDPDAPEEFKRELEPLLEKRDSTESERYEMRSAKVRETIDDIDRRTAEIDNLIADAAENGKSAEEIKALYANEMVALPIRRQLAEVRESMRSLDDINKEMSITDKRTNEGVQHYDELYDTFIKTQRAIIQQSKAITAELKDIINEGRSKRGELINADIEKQSKIVKIGIEAVKKNKLKDDLQRANETTALKNFWENTKHTMDLFQSPAASFDFILRAVDHNHISGEGDLYKMFMLGDEGAVVAHDNYTRGVRDFNEELERKAFELFGTGKATKSALYSNWVKLLQDSNKVDHNHPIRLITYRNIGGDFFDDNKPQTMLRELTKGQMLNVLLTWRQDMGKTKLVGMGFDENSINQIREALGDKYIAFGDYVTQVMFPRLRSEKYDPAYQKVYGTSMHRAANYFPLSISKDAIHDNAEVGEQKVENMPSSASKHNIVRTNNRLPIDLGKNAFDVMMQYGQDSERTAAYAMVTKNINTLIHSIAFGRLLDAQSKGAYKAFKDAAAVATMSFNPDVSEISQFVSKLHSSFMSQAIGYRLYSAAKQTLSYPAFGIYSFNPDYQKRFYGYIFTPVKNYEWAMKNLESFKAREESGNFGHEALREQEIFDFLKADKPHQTAVGDAFASLATGLRQNGMAANKLIDALTVAAGARAVYDYDYKRFYRNLKEQGMSEEEASREADKKAKINATIAFNQSQQSSRPEFSSPMQKHRGIIERSVTAFQSSNIAYHKILLDGIKDIVEANRVKDKDTSRSKLMLRGAAKIANVIFLNSLWWMGLHPGDLSLLLSGKGSKKEDEDVINSVWVDEICGVLSNGTVGGPWASAIGSQIVGSGEGYEPIQVVTQLGDMVKKARKAYTDGQDGALAASVVNYLMQTEGFNGDTFNTAFNSIMNAIDRGEMKVDDLYSMLNLSKTQRKNLMSLETDKDFSDYLKDYVKASKLRFNDPDSYKFTSSFRDFYNRSVEDKDKAEILKTYLQRSMPDYNDTFKAFDSLTKKINAEVKKRKATEHRNPELIRIEVINEMLPDEALRNYYKVMTMNKTLDYEKTDTDTGKTHMAKESASQRAKRLLKEAKESAKGYTPASAMPKAEEGSDEQYQKIFNRNQEKQQAEKMNEIVKDLLKFRKEQLEDLRSKVPAEVLEEFIESQDESSTEDTENE